MKPHLPSDYYKGIGPPYFEIHPEGWAVIFVVVLFVAGCISVLSQ